MKTLFREFASLVLFLGFCVGVGLMLSCKRPIMSNTHTIERIKKDSVVYLPSRKVEKDIPIDSISLLLQDHWYNYFDSLNRAQISYMRDKLGKLKMRATCPPDTIHVNNVYTHEKSTSIGTKTEFRTPWYCWVIIGALGSLSFGLVLGRLFRNLA